MYYTFKCVEVNGKLRLRNISNPHSYCLTSYLWNAFEAVHNGENMPYFHTGTLDKLYFKDEIVIEYIHQPHHSFNVKKRAVLNVPKSYTPDLDLKGIKEKEYGVKPPYKVFEREGEGKISKQYILGVIEHYIQGIKYGITTPDITQILAELKQVINKQK